ncbi:MAG: MFS transporter [bacterium]
MNVKAVQQRIMAALFLAQGLFTAATIAAFTLSPIIAAELGGRDGVAGLPSTVTLLGRAAVAYPAGWLMDRIGRRLGLSLGFLLGIAGAVVSIVAILYGSLSAFLVGAFLLGGLRGIAEQGRYVAAEVFSVERRARAIGIVVFAGTLGAIGGPLLVGPAEAWLESLGTAGWTGPFVAAGVLLVVGLVICFLMLRPDPLHVGRALEAAGTPSPLSGAAAGPPPVAGLWAVFRRPALRLSVLAMSISQLVMLLLMVVTPLHMDHQNHDTPVISLVIMAHTLGMFGLSGVSGWLVTRLGALPMIAIGALVMVASAVMTPLVIAVPLLGLALFLLGLGWNICFVAGSALLAQAVSAGERGRVQGASEAFVALASGVGSVGAGVLFEQAGMVLLSVVSVALCLALLAATLFAAMPARRAYYAQPGSGSAPVRSEAVEV